MPPPTPRDPDTPPAGEAPRATPGTPVHPDAGDRADAGDQTAASGEPRTPATDGPDQPALNQSTPDQPAPGDTLAGDAGPAAPPVPAGEAKPRHRGRRLLLGLGGGLLLLIAGLGLLLWWLGRTSTLDYAVEQAVARSGGKVDIQGAKGSFYGPLAIERAVFDTEGQRIVLKHIALDWNPSRLSRRVLEVTRLEVGAVEVLDKGIEKEDEPPPEVPDTLRLPVRLELPTVKIGRVTLTSAKNESVRAFSDIAVAVEDQGEHYVLRLDRLHFALDDNPRGDATARVRLATEKPYAISGRARAEGTLGEQAFATDLRLGGSLPALTVNADAGAGPAALRAGLRVEPFTENPLRNLTATASGINPRTFSADAPQAKLNLETNLAIAAGGAVRGGLRTGNALPGPLDQERLPFAAASARLGGTMDALAVTDLVLDLGPAGRLSGGAATGEDTARLTLSTRNLNLAGLQSTLAPTALQGTLSAAQDGERQSVEARFDYQRFALLLSAVKTGQDVRLERVLARAGESELSAQGRLDLDGRQPFQAEARLAKFNPADFGDFPKGDVNARLALAGEATPLTVTGTLALADSRFRGEALTGGGRFRATPTRVVLDDFSLALGRNRLGANGAFGAADDRLAFTVRAPSLAALGPAFGGSLSGEGVLAGEFKRPSVQAALSARDLRAPGLKPVAQARLKLAVTQEGETLLIKTAEARAGRAELDLSGRLGLGGERAFDLQGRLAGLDPSTFGDYPQALLNAELGARGKLAPTWQAAVDLDLHDSRFRGQPLAVEAKLQASPERVWDADLRATLAQNRLTARGAFGHAGDTLRWSLDGEKLAALGPGFAGRAEASGTLAGRLASPSLAFEAAARELRLPGEIRLATLDAEGSLREGATGPFRLDARLSGLATPQIELTRAELDAAGTRARHTLSASARNADFDAQTRLAGGWSEARGWAGEIETLRSQGKYPVRLLGPAGLAAGPQGFRLAGARLDVAGGRLNVAEAQSRAGRLSTRGDMTAFPLAFVLALTGQTAAETDLKLGARWDLAAAEDLDGRFELWREAGDVVMQTEPRTALGLTQLRLTARADDSRVRADFDLAGRTVGELHATAATRLTSAAADAPGGDSKAGGLALAKDAPLEASARGSMPSLAWLSPLLGPAAQVKGRLALDIQAAGTVNAPRLSGRVDGDGLYVALPEQAVELQQGELRLVLAGETLRLERFRFRGGQGTLAADGTARLTGGEPQVDLNVRADRLEALTAPDRHLVASGTAKIALAERRLDATGDLTVDEAVINLPDEERPTLSEDVVIAGAETDQKPAGGPPLAVNARVRVDLGERLFVKGKGLDARVEGQLVATLAGDNEPRASGTIRVAEGTYTAYGRRLDIERGVVNFAGPVDNPRLDILAMRTKQDVEAGVAITGTALSPLVTLVSRPSVPDSEKLAWLVLGHPLGQSDAGEFNLLQAASQALIARGESTTLQGKLETMTGLDEIGFAGGGTLAESVVTLGKQVSDRAFLSYERSLTGAANLLKIKYLLSPRWSVQAQGGSDNAVDLFYTLDFD